MVTTRKRLPEIHAKEWTERARDESLTLGARKLARILASMPQDEVASKLGASQQSVSTWASGSRRPSAEMRDRLAEILRIPRSSWLSAEERAARKQLSGRRAA